MIEGKRFDEFRLGDKYVTSGRTITETDIVNFVCLVGITEELFTNVEFIHKHSVFKTRVAPGPLTYAVAEALGGQTGIFRNTAMALLGLSMRTLAPVKCNDTIHCDIEVTDKIQTSSPERGVVKFQCTVRNQRDEAVMEYEATRMIKR